jgi:hypothetical protein
VDNHASCKAFLKTVRARAKYAGVNVGRITTDGRNEHGQIQLYKDGKKEGSRASAHCAYEAKAKYISTIMDRLPQRVYLICPFCGARKPMQPPEGYVMCLGCHEVLAVKDMRLSKDVL